MAQTNLLSTAFSFIAYIILQVVFLKNVALFDIAFCFVYISFILLLPIDINRFTLLVTSFFVGLTIDVFYDSLGIHAAACVLIAYLRTYIINLLQPSGGYDMNAHPTIQELGFQWFVTYSFLLIFIHHLCFFILEASNFELIIHSLSRALASSLFTLSAFIILQFLLYFKRKRAL
ncbi:Rod shape-determining protein MreD [Rapidithrix thailandica]|uniref:Rod shape-determining protein MreD n=1 Tax=Rapidithrix thailandica TaxID=413964 RepID=A0AAW9S708_9BACT